MISEHFSPFLVASRRAKNWIEVLRCYEKTILSVQDFYTPTVSELTHGVKQMTTSWAVSLFFYNIVKKNTKGPLPSGVCVAALQQYKFVGNFNGMKRIFEEEMEAYSNGTEYSTLVLASCTGMWEKAIEMYSRNPKLGGNPAATKNVIKSLCTANKWEQCLYVLALKTCPIIPAVAKPVIKNLSVNNQHTKALHLAAIIMASGYNMDTELFGSLIPTAKMTGKWCEVLRSAQKMNILSIKSSKKTFQLVLCSHLLDCLYHSNVYHSHSIEDVVSDVTSRLHPRPLSSSRHSNQHFRLLTNQEVLVRHLSTVQTLNTTYKQAIQVPRWHKKSLHSIVDIIYERKSVGIVLDTNFLMQCISKNIPFDHFVSTIVEQHPKLKEWGLTTIILPFTTIQEVHHLVWHPSSRLRHTMKLLLWSRFLTFVEHQNVHCLSLITEYPCSSLSILSQMSYSKSAIGSHTHFFSNPDSRILNVCLYLHHCIRGKELALRGSPSAEGILLFSFLKYHVRRYNNTIKGAASNRLLLCTLDKSLSRAASNAGVLCFPVFNDHS